MSAAAAEKIDAANLAAETPPVTLREGAGSQIAGVFGLNFDGKPEAASLFDQSLAAAPLSQDEILRLNSELESGTLGNESITALKQKLDFSGLTPEQLTTLDGAMNPVAPAVEPVAAPLENVAAEAVAPPVTEPHAPEASDTHVSLPPIEEVTEAIRRQGEEQAAPLMEKYEGEKQKYEALTQEAQALNQTMGRKRMWQAASNVAGAVIGAAGAFFGTRGSNRWLRAGASLVGLIAGGIVGSKVSQYVTLRPVKKKLAEIDAREQEIRGNTALIQGELQPIVEATEARIGEVTAAYQQLSNTVAEQIEPSPKSHVAQVRPEGVQKVEQTIAARAASGGASTISPEAIQQQQHAAAAAGGRSVA